MLAFNTAADEKINADNRLGSMPRRCAQAYGKASPVRIFESDPRAKIPLFRRIAGYLTGLFLLAVAAVPSEGIDMENYVAGIEKDLLKSALAQANGVQTKAAEMLRISYRSFRHLMKKYDL